MSLETVNFFLAIGTLAMEVIAVALLVVFFLQRRIPDLADAARPFARHGLLIGFLASLVGAATTLVHSYYFGLPPCDLCWWQRIFLYPQVVLFGLAYLKGDTRVANYSIALSVLGAAVAAYHHMLQMFPAGTLPCPSQGVSCAQILFLEFGYITYPMMGLSLFGFLIVLMLFVRRT